MSDEELRALELEENTAREALTDFETSKQRLAQIRQAEAELKAKAENEVSSRLEKTSSKGGRPTKRSTSREKLAKESGISETEQIRVERHVELAERYPLMQRAGCLVCSRQWNEMSCR